MIRVSHCRVSISNAVDIKRRLVTWLQCHVDHVLRCGTTITVAYASQVLHKRHHIEQHFESRQFILSEVRCEHAFVDEALAEGNASIDMVHSHMSVLPLDTISSGLK